MKVHFKGTRGSLPTAPTAQEIEEKIIASLMAARGKELRSERQIREFVSTKLNFRTRSHWGGNTPCIHVETGSDDYLILDGGSGLRALGKELMLQKVSGATFHIFLSHFHYDHVQGIPFFAPAYAPSNRVVFHGGHQGIEGFLRQQMKEPFFPIGFDTFGASISFEEHKPGDTIEVCDSRITLFEQNHPGMSYGYRIENGKSAMVTRLTASTPTKHTLKIILFWTLFVMPIFWSLMPPTPSLNRLETVITGVTPAMSWALNLPPVPKLRNWLFFITTPTPPTKIFLNSVLTPESS